MPTDPSDWRNVAITREAFTASAFIKLAATWGFREPEAALEGLAKLQVDMVTDLNDLGAHPSEIDRIIVMFEAAVSEIRKLTQKPTKPPKKR